MKSPVFDKIKQTVKFFSTKLRFDKFQNTTGRKLAISINNILSLSLYKSKQGIPTKKAVWDEFKNHFNCTYKTFVVNMNRWYFLALIILTLIMKINRKNCHLIKHLDSTEIPVCLFKNAHAHKTMKHFASYRKKGNKTFYGLKLHIITDLKRQLLSIKFTGAKTDDRDVVIKMSEGLTGMFVADAGYISEKLSKEFYQENKRILFAKPRSNIKKIMTKWQDRLYSTRMLIELNFRSLKMFYGLITSLPRSVDGYLANYIYSILAYQIS